MSIFNEPKIDCHNHLLDPANFPYNPAAWYHPVENEQGSAEQLIDLFDAFAVRHAVVVGPNSGYDTDNRCLLDLLERGEGRFKGVAVVDNDSSHDDLAALRAMSPAEQAGAVAFLVNRGLNDWRDVEALASIALPAARTALLAAMRSDRTEIRHAVTRYTPDLVSEAERVALLVRGLETEERRVGKECHVVCRSRWSPYH